MGDFTTGWLALREPADFDARAARLTSMVADRVADDEVRAIDLASGTGSTVRYLAPRLSPHQDWLLVDHDPLLLAEVPGRMREWGLARGLAVSAERAGLLLKGDGLTCHLEVRRTDLSDLADAGLFAGRTLVTASALLDLVSERWLRVLAARCREQNATGLFALNYDGRMSCSPEEEEDALIRQLVNRHQQRDKGFGAALGPDAPATAERLFAAAGYEVRREASDWVLSAADGGLQQALIDGWAEAASDIAPAHSAAIVGWQARRLAHVALGRSQLRVGHQDVAAWLPGTPAFIPPLPSG